MKEFKVGYVYEARSVCDNDCVFRAHVLSRTEKTVTVDLDNEIKYPRYSKGKKTFKVKDWDGVECFKMGSYSMAPIFRADKTTAYYPEPEQGPCGEYVLVHPKPQKEPEITDKYLLLIAKQLGYAVSIDAFNNGKRLIILSKEVK